MLNNILRMALREMRFRWMNSLLSLSGVIFSVACAVILIISMYAYQERSGTIAARTETRTRERMQAMEKQYEKIAGRTGRDILIIPEGQKLGDMYDQGYAAKTMPEGTLDMLAAAVPAAAGNFVARLKQRVKWPEQKRTVLLIGTGTGERQKPGGAEGTPAGTIPKGKVRVGYELHWGKDLTKGTTLDLFGEKFIVHECLEQQGTSDDITLWLNLRDAQRILKKEGRINEILASILDVHYDRERLKNDILHSADGIQVIFQEANARTRSRTLAAASSAARNAVAIEKSFASRLLSSRKWFLALFLPLICICCGAWVLCIAVLNVRERLSEIGTLTALSFSARSIITLFGLKALIIGLAGSILGCLAGIYVAAALVNIPSPAGCSLTAAVLIPVTLLITVPAGSLPAAVTLRRNPAGILAEE